MSIIYNGPERFEVLSNILRTNNLLALNQGVEVGTRYGDLAEYMLRVHKILHLTCVDSYPPYQDISAFFTKEMQDQIYKDAKKRLAGFASRCELLRKDSIDAAPLIKDGSQDFVFLDADHSYEHIKADLWAWYPKVRAGGIICGHDISMDGVKQAVGEWISQFGKELFKSDTNSDIWVAQI